MEASCSRALALGIAACVGAAGAFGACTSAVNSAAPGADGSTLAVDGALPPTGDATPPPQDGSIDSTLVDSSVADTGASDTSAPDTSVADSEVADTNVPDTNVVEGSSPTDASDASALPDAADAATADPCAVHSPCEPGVRLPATCDCAVSVCAGPDPHCCTTSWDLSCVDDARQYCSALGCPFFPIDGGYGGPAFTTYPMKQIALSNDMGCALSTTGDVWCWGDDATGQVGDGIQGSSNPRWEPRRVLSGATSVAVGTNVACAIVASGNLSCWGQWDFVGADAGLDMNVTTPPTTPILTKATALGVSAAVSCGVAGGKVSCWGFSQYGMLGPYGVPYGQGNLLDSPQQFDLSSAGSISHTVVRVPNNGPGQVCVLNDKGVAICWGYNNSNQLGNAGSGGTPYVTCLPASASDDGGNDCSNALSNITELSIGSHTAAVTSDGVVHIWGNDFDGITHASTPYTMKGLAPAAHVGAGQSITCASFVDLTKPMECWGYYDGAAIPSVDAGAFTYIPPTPIPGLSHVVQIALAMNGTGCVLKDDGSVWCWGDANANIGTNNTQNSHPNPLTKLQFVSFP